MSLDLAIKNGTAYIDGVFRKCDIGIKDGKIAMLASSGSLPESAREIGAENKHVIPGGCDPHVHIRTPSNDAREDFFSGTMSAAQGGCTTVFEHPISTPPPYTLEILENRKRLAGEDCVVDIALFGACGGEFPEEITKLPAGGIVAYKTFLHQAPEGRDKEFRGLTMSNDGEIFRGMQEVAKTGVVLAAHCENNDMIATNIKRLRAEGRVGNVAHCESRPPITETQSVEKMIRLAGEAGVVLDLVHLSAPESVELAKKARYNGQKILIETCPHYLFLNEDTVVKFGPFAKCNPPLRKQSDVDRLWKYINDGTIDFIGSDHGPFLLSEKEMGYEDIFKSYAGFPGVDMRLPLMVDAAQRGLLSLERAIDLCCVNPAKCFDLFPQKGALSVGSDADVVIMDLGAKTKVDKSKSYSKARETARVYDGWELACRLEYTIVRGRVIVDKGIADESSRGWGKVVAPVRRVK